MAKKSGGSKTKANAAKKAGGNKPKKAGMFQSLKKERRTGVIAAHKNDPHSSKRKAKIAKRPVSDEFRNFDERMAAKSSRKPGIVPKKAAVAPPSFVMAAPTFQFNTNPVQLPPAPREVQGFQGFMSALEAPRDAPMTNQNQETRKVKSMQPEYHGSNVFAVLDNGDEQQQTQMTAQVAPPPAIIQPATFSFATAKPTFNLHSSSSLCQSTLSVPISGAQDIDPDL